MKYTIELSKDDMRRLGAALSKRTQEADELSKELLLVGKVEASEVLEAERSACADLHVRLIKVQTG
jgi:hypothetical protein